MTVFQELTKGMKFSEPVEDIKKNMVKVFERNFRCPPWNDRYDDGCKEFTGCESCWFGYINSEAEQRLQKREPDVIRGKGAENEDCNT